MQGQHTLEDLFWLGIKIVVRNPDNQILILKQENKNKKVFWELPGGRMQVGETELEALHREMAEETGITKIHDIHHLRMVRSQFRGTTKDQLSVGLIFSIFTGSVESNEVVLSEDHVDYAWVAQEQVMQLVGDIYGEIFTQK